MASVNSEAYQKKGLVSTLKTKFGRRLREIRNQKRLTQEQLAELLGISVESTMQTTDQSPSVFRVFGLAQPRIVRWLAAAEGHGFGRRAARIPKLLAPVLSFNRFRESLS